MSEGRTEDRNGGASALPEDERLANALTHYIDRLCAGEKLDPDEVRREHPDLASELLAELETFEGIGRSRVSGTPLERLGQYRLLEEVGYGGMGIVYRAIDETLEREVAVKVPRGFAGSSKSVLRFVNEAKVAGKLTHPAIVPVYGMGIDQGVPYYAMEFVEGETLAEILARCRRTRTADGSSSQLSLLAGELSVESSSPDKDARAAERTPPERRRDGTTREDALLVARAFAEVAEGLAHAHAAGVVHRDVKPSNLIFEVATGAGETSRLRILDFGLARIDGQESLTATGALIGTVLYMSPEQAVARDRQVDHRTDIYSLGATLYEVLGGVVPFRGRDHRDTLNQILLREPQPLRKHEPSIPIDLDTIVLKCLSKEPEDRYPSAESLAQDLRRFVAGEAIAARPLGSWERAWRHVRRRKALTGAAVAVALLIVTSALLFVKYREDDRAARTAQFEGQLLQALELIEYGAGRAPHVDVAREHRGDNLPPTGFAFQSEIDVLAGRDPIVQALEVLESAEELLPGRPEIAYHRARALHARGDAAGASEVLRRFDEAPGRKPFAPARILLALIEAESSAPTSVPTVLLAERSEEPGGSGESDARTLRGEGALVSRGVDSSLVPSGASKWELAYARAQQASFRRERENVVKAYDEFVDSIRESGDPYLGASLEARLARGRAQLELGSVDDAIADFAGVHAVRSSSLEPVLLLARAFLRSGNERSALRQLESLWTGTAFRTEVAKRATEALYLEGSYERAAEWAERIDDELSRDLWRVLCQSKRGEHETAERLGSALTGEHPGSYRAWHTLGAVRFTATRYEKAVEAFQRAVDLAENNPRCWKSLGEALHRVAYHTDYEYAPAISALRRAQELAPRDAGMMSALAYALRSPDTLDECESWARAALASDPRCLSGINALALANVSRGKFGEAITWYKRGLAIEADSPALLNNMAWAHCLRGEYRVGLETSKRALALRPDDPEIWKILGDAHFFLGEYAEARDAFTKLVELAPRYFLAHYNLGCAHEALEDTNSAIDAYGRALELRPEHFRSSYNLGNVFTSLKRYDDAIASYKNGLEHKKHPYLWYNLADACLAAEKLDDAAEYFDETLKLTPEDPEAWDGLAKVREQQGNIAEAIRLLEKAQELLPATQDGAESPAEITPGSTAALRSAVAERLERLRGLPADSAKSQTP